MWVDDVYVCGWMWMCTSVGNCGCGWGCVRMWMNVDVGGGVDVYVVDVSCSWRYSKASEVSGTRAQSAF